MRAWFIHRSIAAFEKRYAYDMGYARELLRMSPRGMTRFIRFLGLAMHREDVPLEAWYATKLAATLAEDCGPCTQLVVRMAEEAGVAPAVLRGVLAGDDRAMGEIAALGYRFAEATIRHGADLGRLRDAVVARWGERALASLALTIAASRVFPTVKYALGHGQQCQRIEVAGADSPLARRAA